jgi:hypothetical protein
MSGCARERPSRSDDRTRSIALVSNSRRVELVLDAVSHGDHVRDHGW